MVTVKIVERRVVFIGIDASSRHLPAVALTVYDGDEPSIVGMRYVPLHASSKPFSPATCGRGYDALVNFLSELSSLDRRIRFRVFIEMPVVYPGGRGHSSNVQSFVNGSFQAAATKWPHTTVDFVSPAKWKKAVLGKGNLDKPGITAAVESRWPAHYEHVKLSQDVVDAYCIARFAYQVGPR